MAKIILHQEGTQLSPWIGCRSSVWRCMVPEVSSENWGANWLSNEIRKTCLKMSDHWSLITNDTARYRESNRYGTAAFSYQIAAIQKLFAIGRDTWILNMKDRHINVGSLDRQGLYFPCAPTWNTLHFIHDEGEKNQNDFIYTDTYLCVNSSSIDCKVVHVARPWSSRCAHDPQP